MSSQVKIEEVIHEGKVYLPPCQVACPLKEDIQHSHALISLLPPDIGEARDQIINIADEIYEKNPLMPVASYVCGLCEKECNYKDQTGAIRRKLLVRFLSDYYLPYLKTKPELAPPTKEKIAAVGGGPGSLMCAYVLAKKGYRVTILERNPKLGGALRLIPRYRLPEAVLDTTLDNLVRIAHIEVETGTGAGSDGKTLDELKREDSRQYSSLLVLLSLGLLPLEGVKYQEQTWRELCSDWISFPTWAGKRSLLSFLKEKR